MGQGGNVSEWEETDFCLVNDYSSFLRGVRGGPWFDSFFCLRAANRSNGTPTVEDGALGFRVASIPEPSTLLLGAMAGLGLLRRRRR